MSLAGEYANAFWTHREMLEMSRAAERVGVTLTRACGSWEADGFSPGDEVMIDGSTALRISGIDSHAAIRAYECITLEQDLREWASNHAELAGIGNNRKMKHEHALQAAGAALTLGFYFPEQQRGSEP